MADVVVDVTQIEDRLAAVEQQLAALLAEPVPHPPSVDVLAAVTKVHELVKAWAQVPVNGWRPVEDF